MFHTLDLGVGPFISLISIRIIISEFWNLIFLEKNIEVVKYFFLFGGEIYNSYLVLKSDVCYVFEITIIRFPRPIF